jgi:hypothetical protein
VNVTHKILEEFISKIDNDDFDFDNTVKIDFNIPWDDIKYYDIIPKEEEIKEKEKLIKDKQKEIDELDNKKEREIKIKKLTIKKKEIEEKLNQLEINKEETEKEYAEARDYIEMIIQPFMDDVGNKQIYLLNAKKALTSSKHTGIDSFYFSSIFLTKDAYDVLMKAIRDTSLSN